MQVEILAMSVDCIVVLNELPPTTCAYVSDTGHAVSSSVKNTPDACAAKVQALG